MLQLVDNAEIITLQRYSDFVGQYEYQLKTPAEEITRRMQGIELLSLKTALRELMASFEMEERQAQKPEPVSKKRSKTKKAKTGKQEEEIEAIIEKEVAGIIDKASIEEFINRRRGLT